MLRYIIRRLMVMIPVLIGVSIIVFVMMRMVPGDPARQALGPEATGDEVARLHHQWGLDKPLPVQYGYWVERVMRGDFGRSTVSRVPVTTEIWARFPNTLWLTLSSMVVSIVIGLGSGVIAAVRHNSLVDRGSMLVALLGVSGSLLALGKKSAVEALYQLALAYADAGDMVSARREVLRALEQAPNYSKAQDLLLRIRSSRPPGTH